MSTNTVNFTISNPALSFLLHDCVKSSHNQIGFLFGEIHKEVSEVTSDLHSNNECIEITVSITATLPVEDLSFSKDGTLNEEILDIILGDYKKDVVGWYSFTRNLDLSPSIYQLFLAHQLCDYFSNVPEHLFLFLRITTNVVFDENFTYTNKFVCTTGPDISTPVELHIRQLGESTYTYNAHKPVTSHCEMFDSVLNTIEWKSDDIVSAYEALQALVSAKLVQQIDHETKPCDQVNRMLEIEPNRDDQTCRILDGGDGAPPLFNDVLEEFRMQACPGAPPDPPDCELREEKMDQSVDSSPGSDFIPSSPPHTGDPPKRLNATNINGNIGNSPQSRFVSTRLSVHATRGRGNAANVNTKKPGRVTNRASSPSVSQRSSTLNARGLSPLRTSSPLRNTRTPKSNGTTPRAGSIGSPDLSGNIPSSKNTANARGLGTVARGGKQNQSVGVHQAKPNTRGQKVADNHPNPADTKRTASNTQGSKPVRILSRDMPLDTSYDSTCRRDSQDSPVSNSQTSNSSDNEVDKSRSSYQSQEY